MIAEAIHISKQGTYPRAPEIETQAQIDGWKRVVKAVHDKGGFIFSQIWHSGRATNAIFCPDGSKPLAPSPIAINGLNSAGLQGEMPEEITIDQIKTVYQQFVQRAKNSMAAGFDGVEIHGANGYLIDEFINTSSNKRTDAYGGSIENRCRFVLELVDQVVDAIGEERVAVRFSPWSEYQDMEDETPYETWGYIVKQLQKNHPNLAYLHFIEHRERPDPEDPTKILFNSLDPIRKLWKGPFMSAGYTNKEKEAMALSDRTGDMVSFGRAFIANPDLVDRLKNDWPLNKYDRDTFYTGDELGYNDYPFYDPKSDQ